jgi:protein SCO1/2
MSRSSAVKSLAAAVAVALTGAACTIGPSEEDPARDGQPPAVVTGASDNLGLHGTVVDPPLDRPKQELLDARGHAFSVADRPADEVTVLFFGYTHCPDVCPTTMADLAQARSRLPEQLRSRLQVVFVTEDPRRDTPSALRRWLRAFDPTFVGLIGGNAATRQMIESLHSSATRRVAAPEKPIKHPDSGHGHHRHGRYGIEHTGIVYAWAPGDLNVIYTGGTTPTEYAADFIRLLEGAS